MKGQQRILYNRIDKEAMSRMETVTFQGRIITILTECAANQAVDYLLSYPLLGIDTETRPSFHKGEHHQVALLQVATDDTCFLFRLNRIGMPASVVRLLSDAVVPKIGLSLHDDLAALRERGSFEVNNFIELQAYAARFGIEDKSLQKIYANLFAQRISKRQQRSNWEADVLSSAQQMYAAIDAWACLRIYKELKTLSKVGYRLEQAVGPVPVINQ